MSAGNMEEMLGRTTMREAIELYGDLIQLLETLSTAALGKDTRLMNRRFREFEVRERRLDRCLVEGLQAFFRAAREVLSESARVRFEEELGLSEADLAPGSIGASVSRAARHLGAEDGEGVSSRALGLRLATLCSEFDSGKVDAAEFAEKTLEFQDELHERRLELREVHRRLEALRSEAENEDEREEIPAPCLAASGASISCRGKTYAFTGPVQRQIMEFMFREWERQGGQDGAGTVTEDQLHVELGRDDCAQATRVAKLFRGRPRIREILIRVEPATWALFLAGEPPEDPGW